MQNDTEIHWHNLHAEDDKNEYIMSFSFNSIK